MTERNAVRTTLGRSLSGVWLAAAIAVASPVFGMQPAAPGGPTGANPGRKRFVFDNGLRATPGLRLHLDRPVPTVDPTGLPIGPHVPRYAPETALAGAPVFEQVRASAAPLTVVAAGLDRDGVTPLLVTYEANPVSPMLDVFAAGGADLVLAEQTGVGRMRTMLPGTGDLLNGSVPGRRYRLASGVVCHGLIVLFCTVTTFDASAQAWRDSGNAFVLSQDRGATWKLAYESPPFAPGPSRGAPWGMQNWWPVQQGARPTEAYFVASDYCANPGSPGGRLYIAKAVRDGVDDAWTFKPGGYALEVSGNSSEHVHSGGVLPLPGGGLRAFAALGDGRTNNRVVSLFNSGTDPGGPWALDPSYHGARGIPGIEGNQFVGCAPGPFPGTVLAGADLTIEQIALISMSPALDHPVTQRLVGLSALDGLTNVAFVIRTPTPELGGPYVANTEPFFFLPYPFSKRALYSPDGLHWAQAAAPSAGYPTLHAGHIYFDGAPGAGLMRVPAPEVVAGRPLLLGPGLIQHSRADAAFSTSTPERFVPLTRDKAGRWIDDGVVLDPQPPTLGQVYRVRTTSSDASPVVARLYPAGLSNPLNRVLGTQVQVRMWVMHQETSRSGTLQFGLGDSVAAPQVYRTVNLSSVGTWAPVTASERIDVPAGRAFQVFVRCAGEVCNDQTMYVALDALAEGSGMPGYPAPQDASLPALGTPMPDEAAVVSGFTCGKAWTITLALQIPEDGFDFSAGTQSVWPLASLWGDSANEVRLSVDVVRGCVRATVVNRGRVVRTLVSDDITFVRGAPILISIAQPAGLSATGTEMTVSAAGQAVHTRAMGMISSQGPGVPPREIRFGDFAAPASSLGRGVRVSPLLVWGGQIDEQRFLSRAEREQLLRSLRFITLKIP